MSLQWPGCLFCSQDYVPQLGRMDLLSTLGFTLQLFLDHWDTQDLHCSPGHFGWFGTAGRLTAACLHSRRFCLKVLPSVILWKTRSLLATCDIRNVGQTAKSSGSHEVAEKPGMLFGMELHDQVRICGTLLLNRHHHGSRILCRCVCNRLHVTNLLFTDVKWKEIKDNTTHAFLCCQALLLRRC